MSFGYQFITDPKYKNNKEQPPADPVLTGENDQPHFRFSLFQRFQNTLVKEHQDLLFGERDLQLLIYILHCYILNNSLDLDTLDKIVKNLQMNLTESDIMSLSEARVGNLARSLKQVVHSRGMIKFTEFEQTVSKIFLEKYRYRQGQ